MASRSRKKRRRDGPRTQPPAHQGARVAEARPASTADQAETDALRDGYARGRERDERIREGLEPLDAGERPGAVTVAAVVALVLAVANVVAALTVDLSDDSGDPTGFTIITTVLLLACAGGMWKAKYQAVLGFQVILGFQVVIYSLALTRVEKWWLAVVLLVLVGALGYLFWKLIRAMARLQMPERPM